MSSPSATPRHVSLPERTDWSKSEKAIARTAFDAALGRELQNVIQKTKQMANADQGTRGRVGVGTLPDPNVVKRSTASTTIAIRSSRRCLGDSCTKSDSGGRAERLAGGQAEVDPFFRQILGGGRGRLKQPETRVEVYAVKVTLLGTSPPIWRRILVPREITLRNLHRTLQTVMGWTNSHLHQFVCQRPRLLIRDLELGARSQMRTEPSSGN